jgi:hypothetical protein
VSCCSFLSRLSEKSISKTKWKSGYITIKEVLPGVKPPTTVCTSQD